MKNRLRTFIIWYISIQMLEKSRYSRHSHLIITFVIFGSWKKSIYCMSKKSWPNLYSNLLHKMGQDFLDIQMYNWNLGKHRTPFVVPSKTIFVYKCTDWLSLSLFKFSLPAALPWWTRRPAIIYKNGQDFLVIQY